MGWVCLMYHDVVPGTPLSGAGPERFSVPLASFERMLDAIAAAGCVGCSLDEALDGGRHVAITFDDATAGQRDHAVPALCARNMTATFFVTTDWVGTPGFMTWNDLRQLTEWGMSVQSHTRSHPHLSELGHDRLRAELAESKAALDECLQQETTQIALPNGNAPRLGLRHVLAEVGYRVVATSRWGVNAERAGGAAGRPRWIRRCNVPRSLSPELANRIASGDRRLVVARYSREAALNGVRAIMGADRYATWRRRFLAALPRGRDRSSGAG